MTRLMYAGIDGYSGMVKGKEYDVKIIVALDEGFIVSVSSVNSIMYHCESLGDFMRTWKLPEEIDWR